MTEMKYIQYMEHIRNSNRLHILRGKKTVCTREDRKTLNSVVNEQANFYIEETTKTYSRKEGADKQRNTNKTGKEQNFSRKCEMLQRSLSRKILRRCLLFPFLQHHNDGPGTSSNSPRGAEQK